MDKVIIFGTGQIAEVAHFYLTIDSPYQVVAFTADREYMDQSEYHGLPVVPFEEIEYHYPPQEYKLFVPISYKKVNKIRAQRYEQAKRKGYSFITYISSKATYYNTPVGENCFIFENNVIQPFTEIGNNVILWSGNHIGHHTKIKDHCFLASHIVVSGHVTVEPYCFIGVNATIRDNVTIGSECVIGAGSLILKDAPEKSVYIGQRTEARELTSDQLKRI